MAKQDDSKATVSKAETKNKGFYGMMNDVKARELSFQMDKYKEKVLKKEEMEIKKEEMDIKRQRVEIEKEEMEIKKKKLNVATKRI